MTQLVFATSNQDKLREAREILKINVKGVNNFEIDEIQSLDPKKVIKKKAFKAYKLYQCPVLVEDTSLFFEAWQGLPGVFINYFLKSVGVDGLLSMLGETKNRLARAVTYLAIFNGKQYQIAKGEVKGKIPLKPKGDKGFGWDPIFIPNGYENTFAEMAPEKKNKVSMRRKALDKIKKIKKGY